MIPPRYRTLDGDEVELPLAMGSWVLVPRELARFDPELAWTLDYDDAPEPEDADPRLDFSCGALLVPLDRWNEHAEIEPSLAPCYPVPPRGLTSASRELTALVPVAPRDDPTRPGLREALATRASRAVVFGLAALAGVYVLAVGAWLWTLRDGIDGPDVSSGLALVGAAALLAWLGGVAGAGWPRQTSTPCPRGTRRTVGRAFVQLADDPVGILRAGMTLQLAGFAVLVLVR